MERLVLADVAPGGGLLGIGSDPADDDAAGMRLARRHDADTGWNRAAERVALSHERSADRTRCGRRRRHDVVDLREGLAPVDGLVDPDRGRPVEILVYRSV